MYAVRVVALADLYGGEDLMAVYVDNYRADFRGMKMSHLTADTMAELDAMAELLKLRAGWKQDEGAGIVHFDVSESKRLQAIRYGAVALNPRELVMKVRNNVEMNSRAAAEAEKIKSDESLRRNGNEKEQ